MSEERQELAKWLLEQYAAYLALPQARLLDCDEVLYFHRLCCGWHSGMRLIFEYLKAVGAQLLTMSSGIPKDGSHRVEIFSRVWLSRFKEKFKLGDVDLTFPSAPPRLREEDRPRWLMAAHQAFYRIDARKQPSCEHTRFLGWTCCAFHAGLKLMLRYLEHEAEQLVEPCELPFERDMLPGVFSNTWWKFFTEKYDLPAYQPY